MSDSGFQNPPRQKQPVAITLQVANPRMAAASFAALAIAAVFAWSLRLTDAPATSNAAAKPENSALLPAASPDLQSAGWIPTFSDEFDGTNRDEQKWMDAYPDGVRTHDNHELQFYAPKSVTVSGGSLHLNAERRVSGAGLPYTSGMVSSYGRFAQRYGWFEMRARLPVGRGLWPAFWLLPDNRSWPPEIDILEVVGQQPTVALLSNHWGSDATHHEWRTEKARGADFSADFHTFAVDWEPDRIVWYVDGVERHRVTDHVPQTPMFVLANLAVGGDLPGSPDATTNFPAALDVDYIHVFRKSDQNQP